MQDLNAIIMISRLVLNTWTRVYIEQLRVGQIWVFCEFHTIVLGITLWNVLLNRVIIIESTHSNLLSVQKRLFLEDLDVIITLFPYRSMNYAIVLLVTRPSKAIIERYASLMSVR